MSDSQRILYLLDALSRALTRALSPSAGAERRRQHQGRGYPSRKRRNRGRSNVKHAMRYDGMDGLIARSKARRGGPKESPWQRPKATLYIRRQGDYVARVTLGEGGWYWLVGHAKTGDVVAICTQPTTRSRKARRAAQKVLLKTAAQPQPQVIASPQRLAEAA